MTIRFFGNTINVVEKIQLPGIFEIIKKSFLIYIKKENFLFFLKIALLNLGVSFVLLIPAIYFTSIFSKEPIFESIGPATTVFVPTIAIALGAAVWGLLMQATMVVAVTHVVSGGNLGVRQTIKEALRKLGRYFLTNVLTGLAVLVGIILLIIPGLIFMVWYLFSGYIIIIQDVRPIEALKQSKKLVSGYFWQVAGRLLGVMLILIVFQAILGSIPFLGAVIVTLLTPFYVLVPYLIFDSLRTVKGKISA